MTPAVPGRPSRARISSPRPRFSQWLLRSTLLAALPAVLPCVALHAQAPAAPAAAPAAPQIITVTPSAAPQQNSTAPDWNRANPQQQQTQQQQRDSRNRDEAEANREATERRATPTDDVTEFQSLVQQSVGRTLPIFGASLFSAPPSTFAPVGNAQVTADYVIGPGDELRISASGQLNQQASFTVDRAGTITIPEVGTLTVAGLHFSELKPFLDRQFGRIYRNFQLNVTLGQLRSIQVYILGQARQPGVYTVSSLSTLVNALLASGGVLPQGSLRHIQLTRANHVVSEIDLYDLLLHGDKSKDVPLQPGDIIFVPVAGPQVAILGSVTDPAIYELKNETNLAELIGLARGLTSTATGTSARVESIYNHAQRNIVDVDLAQSNTTILKPGDIVTVSAISDQYKDSVTLRGNVANPGRYVWHPGMRLSDLIPNRESLITRNYFRQRNALGQPVFSYGPQPNNTGQNGQGRVAVSTAPSGGSTGNQSEAPTPTAANTGSAAGNGSGTTVGDALTQNNGTFSAATDVVLSAPDVDLAYAVIERLDPVTLTTSLIPFNLAAVVDKTDPAQNLELASSDVVTIFSKSDIRVPQSQQTRFVRLEGEFIAAGVYSVKPGETLRQLIARAGGLTSDAYLYASEFTRQSTRRVEQQRLREYADSLDAQINTAVSSEVSGALDPGSAVQTANAGADAARNAVARIRRLQPTGRIVLKLTPDAAGLEAIPDLPLEDGDRFIVPRQPTSIAVAGQVYNASSFLYAPHLQVRNYLRDAGGPDRNADSKRIFVVRADGSVVSRQYADVLKAPTLPGDTVVVPPQLTHRNVLRDIVSISTAIGTLALPLSVIALVR